MKERLAVRLSLAPIEKWQSSSNDAWSILPINNRQQACETWIRSNLHLPETILYIFNTERTLGCGLCAAESMAQADSVGPPMLCSFDYVGVRCSCYFLLFNSKFNTASGTFMCGSCRVGIIFVIDTLLLILASRLYTVRPRVLRDTDGMAID